MIVTVLPTSDSRAAIQDAVNLASRNGGGCVRLVGHHEIDGSVEWSGIANVCVDGGGATLRQLREHTKTLRFVSGRNVQIRHLALVGCGKERPWASNSQSYNGVAGIDLFCCTDITVSECRFTNHAGGGLILSGTASQIRLEHNTITGMGREFIAPKQNGADAAIGNAATTGPKSNVCIVGNDISGHSQGILSGPVDGLVVSGNVIHDVPGEHGMYFVQDVSGTINGNVISRCDGCGMKFQHQLPQHSDEQRLTVTGNTITDCGIYGIGVFPVSAVRQYYSMAASVVGNTISRIGIEGVNLTAVRHANVSHNVLYGCEQRAIFVNRCGGVVAGNSITLSGADHLGLQIVTSDVQESHNHITTLGTEPSDQP